MREATQTRPWLQQLGGKSKAKCKATKSWATKSKATKSKATKSKAKSDTSPVAPELVAARLPFQEMNRARADYRQAPALRDLMEPCAART